MLSLLQTSSQKYNLFLAIFKRNIFKKIYSCIIIWKIKILRELVEDQEY